MSSTSRRTTASQRASGKGPATRPTLALLVPRDVFGALTALGIDATERGNEASARCPNPEHPDRSASWSCNLDTGEHHCFSCNFGGSFAYLVACMLGKTRAEAASWITERKIKDVAAGQIERPVYHQQAAQVSEADLWMYTDPPAEALASRGLTLESCREYGVRWDNEREMWITLVRDPFTGKLWGWQAKGHGIFNNYPRNLVKSKALFGFELVPAGATVLLVESPLDVPYVLPACADLGVFPVSSYGAAVSDHQIRLLRARASRIILGMDNDEAGWKSTARLAWAFGEASVAVFEYGSSVPVGGLLAVGEPDGRDPGNLSMDEITWGIEHAIPKWRLVIPWL